MLERGWNQFDLADASGYGQPYISKLLSRSDPPSFKTRKKLAEAFDVPVEFFCDSPGFESDCIPLLAKDQAPDWLDDLETLAGTIEDWLPVIVKCSRSTYALRVTSNDMHDPGRSIQYPLNAVIVIDPEKPMKTGSRIICQLTDSRIVFRELQESAGEYYLATLAPSFPAIPLGADFNARYLGRVVATLIYEAD